MNNALLARCAQSFRDLFSQAKDFCLRQRPTSQFFAYGSTMDQFHGQKVDAVLRAELEDGFDVRMLQLAEGQRFSTPCAQPRWCRGGFAHGRTGFSGWRQDLCYARCTKPRLRKPDAHTPAAGNVR